MISDVPVFWIVYAILGIQLIASLSYLGRLREWHHGYYGLALCVVPIPVVMAIGLTMLADDTYQHAVQDMELRSGWPPGPDFSPLHELYVWTYVHVSNWLSSGDDVN